MQDEEIHYWRNRLKPGVLETAESLVDYLNDECEAHYCDRGNKVTFVPKDHDAWQKENKMRIVANHYVHIRAIQPHITIAGQYLDALEVLGVNLEHARANPSEKHFGFDDDELDAFHRHEAGGDYRNQPGPNEHRARLADKTSWLDKHTIGKNEVLLGRSSHSSKSALERLNGIVPKVYRAASALIYEIDGQFPDRPARDELKSKLAEIGVTSTILLERPGEPTELRILGERSVAAWVAAGGNFPGSSDYIPKGK